MSQPSAQNGHVRGHQPVTSEPEDFPTEDLTPDEIPDQLQDDVLVQYLRCRYSQRKDLLGSNPDAKVRVKSEKKRIKKLRKTYEETEENEPVVHDFKRLRAAWKVHAKDKSGDELKNVSKRVSEMRSLKKKPEERKRRIQLERKILSQVQRWDTEQYDPSTPIQANHAPSDSELGSPGCFSGLSRVFGKDTKKGKDKNKKKPFDDDSEEQPKPNRPRPPDSYGITVSKITLKKTPLSSSYMSYEIERYPLNDVLYNKKDNPLKRMADTEDPNTIRYFHFPSNNMHWIEVFIPNISSFCKTKSSFRKPLGDTMTKIPPENTIGENIPTIATSRQVFYVASIGLPSSSKSFVFLVVLYCPILYWACQSGHNQYFDILAA